MIIARFVLTIVAIIGIAFFAYSLGVIKGVVVGRKLGFKEGYLEGRNEARQVQNGK